MVGQDKINMKRPAQPRLLYLNHSLTLAAARLLHSSVVCDEDHVRA
jgi:hypothetical protein